MNELQLQELEELQRASAEELEGFNIDSLDKLNWAFRKVSAINEKVKDIKNLAEAERMRIDEWEKKELKCHNESLSYFNYKISEYHDYILSIDPKAKSIKTPYGVSKSVTTKASPIKSDESSLLEYLKNNNPDYVKEVYKQDVDWAEYKKKLTIIDGPDGAFVVDDNGMIVEGVSVKPQETKFKMEVL